MDEEKTNMRRCGNAAYNAANVNVTHLLKIANEWYQHGNEVDLINIADGKYENAEYVECLKFCERAIKIGKENVVNLDLMRKVLEMKKKMLIRFTAFDKNYPIPQLLALAEDYYNLKAKDRDQYVWCFDELRVPIFKVALTPGSKLHRQKLILQVNLLYT